MLYEQRVVHFGVLPFFLSIKPALLAFFKPNYTLEFRDEGRKRVLLANPIS